MLLSVLLLFFAQTAFCGPVGDGKTLQRPVAFSFTEEVAPEAKVQIKRNSPSVRTIGNKRILVPDYLKTSKTIETQPFLIQVNDESVEEQVANYADNSKVEDIPKPKRNRGFKKFESFSDRNNAATNEEDNSKQKSYFKDGGSDKQEAEKKYLKSRVKNLKDYEAKAKVEEKETKPEDFEEDSKQDFYKANVYANEEPKSESAPYNEEANLKDSYGKPVNYGSQLQDFNKGEKSSSEQKFDTEEEDKKPLSEEYYDDSKSKFTGPISEEVVKKHADYDKESDTEDEEKANRKFDIESARYEEDDDSKDVVDRKPTLKYDDAKSGDDYEAESESNKSEEDVDSDSKIEVDGTTALKYGEAKSADKYGGRSEPNISEEDDSKSVVDRKAVLNYEDASKEEVDDAKYYYNKIRNSNKEPVDIGDVSSSEENYSNTEKKPRYFVESKNNYQVRNPVHFLDDSSAEDIDTEVVDKDDKNRNNYKVRNPIYVADGLSAEDISSKIVDENVNNKNEYKVRNNSRKPVVFEDDISTKDETNVKVLSDDKVPKEENEGKDSSYYEEVVDASAQNVGELKAEASKGGDKVKEVKAKDVKFDKGGGKVHESKHSGSHKERGEKEYKSEGKHYQKDLGHHNKDGHQGSFKKGGEKTEKNHHEDGYYGESHKGNKGKKGAKYDEDGKHDKGHSTKGTHNVHKKDEYEKMEEFYDEYHEEDGKEKAGGSFEHDDHKKGDSYKKSHFDGDHHHGYYGKMKHHQNGKIYREDKGHKVAAGHNNHHDHNEAFKKLKQVEAKKKWTFKHGPEGTYKVVEDDKKQ